MIYERMFKIVKRRLGGMSDITDDYLLDEAALIQELTFEQNAFLPWFLMKRDQDLVVGAGVRTKDFLAGFLREDDEEPGMYSVSDGTYSKLRRRNYDQVRTSEREAGTPVIYALMRDGYIFAGVPEVSTTLKVSAYFADTVPVLSVENLWAKHAADLIVAELIKKIASIRQMEHKMQSAEADVSMAWSRIQAAHIVRQEAGREAVMGGPDAGSAD